MKYLCTLILALFALQSFGQTLEADRLALVAFYTTPGTSWFDNPGWVVPGSPGDSPCGWTGVTCEGGRVTRLDLSMLQVHGPISPEIGKLTALKYLNLEGGGAEFLPWNGELPVELGNLINLEYLNLSHNQIGIANMGVIGNLTKLKELAVTPLGEIPAQWASLVNLEVLFMGSREAFPPSEQYSFPSFLTSFTKLRKLYLIGQLKGAFPAQIGNLTNLEILEIGRYHDLTGQIPPSIGNLSKLKELLIWWSPGLTGPIPAEIGQLTGLIRLAISGESGSRTDAGSIPSELGNLTNLQYLEISGNGITGSIPASFANLTNLISLGLASNQLSGNIPAFLGGLSSIKSIDLGFNQFSGTIPVELTTMPALTNLSVIRNGLTGPLPDLSGLPSTFKVNLIWNKFTFAGLEQNISKLNGYSWQDTVPMFANGTQATNLMGYPATLSVDVGGTPANNTYRWYKNNQLQATNVGNPNFLALDEATYHVVVTNSQLPLLALQSVSYTIVRLPVVLVKFQGVRSLEGSKLTWKTTSETNNKGFEIERSADARAFGKIGFVDGNGDTKEDKTYHFTDLQPFETSYYRLKQLDYDGKFEYSKVIAVRGDQVEIKVYPNPAQEYLTISGIEAGTEVSIINESGRVVLKSRINPKQPIAIGGLRAGLYNVLAGGVSKKLLINR
ncbi:T9SS type A sorting domain-containing protein [Dyadobacter sp. MSC1_007]|jgi:Leucine-rich repeat (LRR) protein|uniref:T9SS type A sorting domain-containing protein n=1 Tax=Dyadobacter sp. MSC1_007 TaxID=2909264 RepID=UPI00202F7B7F|nr:T9SS type A sorting domain-containing protein [Dyadobacter sp. MSC1_007]